MVIRWESSQIYIQYHLHSILAINYPALNNLLQMFTNSMNLNGNKLPILVPSNSSPSQHGNNQSVDIQEQQQHTGSSPRSPLSSNSNNTSYNTDSSLLMCGLNSNTPQNTHLNPNSSLPTSNTAPYLPAMSPLYPNNANALTNASAGKIWTHFSLHYNEIDRI